MSDVETCPEERTMCAGTEHTVDVPELLRPRDVPLGGPRGMPVRRTLPNRERRMVGAWCFADAYGPVDLTVRAGMSVPAHPHIGLQTVSWLCTGEIRHTDSLGSDQLVRPGELNLMTAGAGIAHAEESVTERSTELWGAQLWLALPENDRSGRARFEHHADLPRADKGGGTITLFIGALGGLRSPALVHSPLVGAELAVRPGSSLRVPLDRDFEHAVLPLSEPVEVDGAPVEGETMAYFPPGRDVVEVAASDATRVLLLGGLPFEENLVMWWNLIGRTHEEIVAARAEWERERTGAAPDRFGVVPGASGVPLPAPELPHVRLRERGRFRPR